MLKQKLFPIIICLILFSAKLEAVQSSIYPAGCNAKMVNYKGSNIVLGTKPSDKKFRVYVLYNTSFQPILVRHVTDGTLLDLPMPSVINPNTWTAILLEEDNFILSCQDYSVGYSHAVPCDAAISACELAVSPVMESAQGEYWITENNQTKEDLFATIRKEGIYP